jgi:hypothetical protein
MVQPRKASAIRTARPARMPSRPTSHPVEQAVDVEG